MPFTLYGADQVAPRQWNAPGVSAAEPVRATRPVAREEARGDGRAPRREGRARRGEGETALQAYAETARPRERQPALHAHQIMSSPVTTLMPETTIVEAWGVFREHRFRHIPVVDGEGRLVGIVADRDLLRYAALNGRIPPYGPDSPEARTPIARLMKQQVLTATPDTEIRQIAQVLIEQHIGAMPIMDYRGALVGIVTRSDILRALVTHAPLELWV